MANVFMNISKKNIFDQTFDIKDDADIKMMLIATGTYTPDDGNTVVSDGGANDAESNEANVTGYTRGWQGAGRKVPANRAITVDQTNNRAEFDFDDISFGALGNGSNQTIMGSLLIKEGAANDTTSVPIAFYDFTDFTTNGASFTLQVDAEGAIHLTSLLGCLQLLGKTARKLWSKFSERLTHDRVAALRKLGIEPHIYRSISPVLLCGKNN